MKKADLKKAYEDARWKDSWLQECASCGASFGIDRLDRHHPAGRHGGNVLRYVYICRPCHTKVHDDPAVATKRGLLWPGRNTKDIGDREWSELLETIKANRYTL